MALPSFLIKRTPKLQNLRRLRSIVNDPLLHTVCEEARCPNLGECFSCGTCAFMILGNVCTRNCAFCGVESGSPALPDPSEPKRVAEAAFKLGLKHVVITSVTRDDLPDGGAAHFSKTVKEIRKQARDVRIELLIPDLRGDLESLARIADSGPDVINHNIETVALLYKKVRPQANYKRSLHILKKIKEMKKQIYSKSGFMVGLGESFDEVLSALRDLKAAGCDIVTVGQYLPPSKDHIEPERYVTPEEFEEYRSFGKSLGFLEVLSGPFVRSSYHAAGLKCFAAPQ